MAEQTPAVLPGFLFWQFGVVRRTLRTRPAGCQCLTGKRIQLPGRTCTVKMCACMWRASRIWATLALSTASCRCVASMYLLSAALTGLWSLLPQQTGRSSALRSVRGPLLALCVTQAGCGIFCLCSSLSGAWRARRPSRAPRPCSRTCRARRRPWRRRGKRGGASTNPRRPRCWRSCVLSCRRSRRSPGRGRAPCGPPPCCSPSGAARARRVARRRAACPQVQPERAARPAAQLQALRCGPSAAPPCPRPPGARCPVAGRPGGHAAAHL